MSEARGPCTLLMWAAGAVTGAVAVVLLRVIPGIVREEAPLEWTVPVVAALVFSEAARFVRGSTCGGVPQSLLGRVGFYILTMPFGLMVEALLWPHTLPLYIRGLAGVCAAAILAGVMRHQREHGRVMPSAADGLMAVLFWSPGVILAAYIVAVVIFNAGGLLGILR